MVTILTSLGTCFSRMRRRLWRQKQCLHSGAQLLYRKSSASVCQTTTPVLSEIPQQLLDGMKFCTAVCDPQKLNMLVCFQSV